MKRLLLRLSAILCAGAVFGSAMFFCESEAHAQRIFRPLKQQRRQERLRKQMERREQGNKLAPAQPGQPEATADNSSPRLSGHSLDGIKSKGIAEFFPKEERELVIRGFGRPASYLVILRQLDLTEEQKVKIKALGQRIGNQLINLRTQHNRLDQQLEDSIYGENFDQKQIDDLASQTGSRQAEITKMLAHVEAQFRQILSPDQFYVFRFLVGEMLLPQRRIQPNILRQQQLQRRMNQQNRPENFR